MRNSRRMWLRWAPCRSNQEALVRLERRHKCFYDCFKIGLLARNSACCECNSRIRLLELGYAGSWLKGVRGRGGRLNNTSAAARRVSSNFSSRLCFEAEEVHSRLPRRSLTNLLFTLRFAVSNRNSALLERFAASLCLSPSSPFYLSLSLFLSPLALLHLAFSLSQTRHDLSNLTFMHAHTTHNIV